MNDTIVSEKCWILVRADGTPIDNGEYVEHYTSQAKAAQRAADDATEGDLGPGCFTPGTPRQLDQPCLTVQCGCCNEELDECGEGYTVHFETITETDLVERSGWTVQRDGTFLCPGCGPDGDCGDCREQREAVAGRG